MGVLPKMRDTTTDDNTHAFERLLTAALFQTMYYLKCSNVLSSFRGARIDEYAQRLDHS